MALTAALFAGAAATVSTIDQGRDQARAARNLANDQANTQDRLNREFAQHQKDQESSAASLYARDQAKERQRREAAAASGRRDTILTGPLGLPGTGPGERKTLLGV